jgi:maleylpyruvate isomerase
MGDLTDEQALEDSLRWMREGAKHLQAVVDSTPDDRLLGSLALPGWTGRHLLAHLAGNARALRRLTRWAATGAVTPMYASTQDREREIEEGSRMPVPRLRLEVADQQHLLERDLAGLPEERWTQEVTTAQGRRVAAALIPWLRAREVWVHAADLDGGDFTVMPEGFLARLITDVLQRRRTTTGEQLQVIPLSEPEPRSPVTSPSLPPGGDAYVGTPAQLARWLTRRGSDGVRRADGSALQPLTPWL